MRKPKWKGPNPVSLMICFIFITILRTSDVTGQTQQPCRITTPGQSSIILDIEESRQGQIDQLTRPPELPISGEPSNVELRLIFPQQVQYFVLNGKKLQLVAPLDRDAADLSSIAFQVACTVNGTTQRRTYPVIVRVSDINDNPPRFLDAPYSITTPELLPIGSTVFRGLRAIDPDSGVNGLIEFLTAPGDGSVTDGSNTFAIEYPHQGIITLKKPLDFETQKEYFLTIVASDRALNTSERLSATTTLTIHVQDGNDLDPTFLYDGCTKVDRACVNPEYTATVPSEGIVGLLDLLPEKIRAEDMDLIGAPIRFTFLSGMPHSYEHYFDIHPITGTVSQIESVSGIKGPFEIIIKAQELDDPHRFSTAKLVIRVTPSDLNAPVLTPSENEGFVLEGSSVGTPVLTSSQEPLTLVVTDADLRAGDPHPGYVFELTSSFFGVDQNGILSVGQEGLDRDPPNPENFRIQVVAREIGSNVASAPVTLIVHLLDANDNTPILEPLHPVTVGAGEGRRKIAQAHATDTDTGENAVIRYSIFHVSNGGQDKFLINETTGVVETAGRLYTGDRYSITIEAKDLGGLKSQRILEVEIVPGPNLRPPVFSQQIFNAQVSEGAALHSAVTTVTAVDPEGDPIQYAIIGGNELLQFGVSDVKGTISIIRNLDREELSRYSLVVRAGDTGGLTSTATVDVRVTDINDKNPQFVGLPYNFGVIEGKANVVVGKVRAVDADEGENGRVYYSVPDDSPVIIDTDSGAIRTKLAMDFEQQKVHHVVVTAKDGAPDPRIATATVTLSVQDADDELPIFRRRHYEVNVPENSADYFVVEVQAEDLDFHRQINYVIRQGPVDKFYIDSETGVIRTIKALNFEEETRFKLIIGTRENIGSEPGDTATVIINVEDRNDIPPIFVNVPRPIRIKDTIPIGNTITTMLATDSDGTAPNNKVKYEIIDQGKSSHYFKIDSDTGEIQVRDDLRKELDVEYKIPVRTYDLGEPHLSSQANVIVLVEHIATVPPDNALRFAESHYTVEISENALSGHLVKRLTVINKPGVPMPLECQLIVPQELETLFNVETNEDRDCEIHLTTPQLDHEVRDRYNLTVKLHSLSGLLNPSKATSTVEIRVLDVNDNRPEFEVPVQFRQMGRHQLFGAVAKDAEVGTNVMQLQAKDKDSGKFGDLMYEIEGSDDYFNVEQASGLVRTARSLESLDENLLPFKITAKVRDNPKDTKNSLTSDIPLVINVINEEHRIILVIKGSPPQTVRSQEPALIEVLQDQARLLVGVERMAVAKLLNSSQDSDPESTDVWLYAIDPVRLTILPRDDAVVSRNLLSSEAKTQIAYYLNSNLGVHVTEIREPVQITPPVPVAPVIQSGGDWEGFPAALVALGGIIFVLAIIGSIYICVLWTRYKNYKERASRMVLVPKYEPVFVESNLKEYETQVLQMSVPIDEVDSFPDLQLDLRAHTNHAFTLDNVSYITKGDSIGKHSPDSALSDGATTARVDSRLDRSDSDVRDSTSQRHLLGITMDREELSPVRNPLYERSSDEEDEVGRINISATNENVLFREKKDYSKRGFAYLMESPSSPVEAMTEL